MYRLLRKERSHVPFHRQKEREGFSSRTPSHNQPRVLEVRYRVCTYMSKGPRCFQAGVRTGCPLETLFLRLFQSASLEHKLHTNSNLLRNPLKLKKKEKKKISLLRLKIAFLLADRLSRGIDQSRGTMLRRKRRQILNRFDSKRPPGIFPAKGVSRSSGRSSGPGNTRDLKQVTGTPCA